MRDFTWENSDGGLVLHCDGQPLHLFLHREVIEEAVEGAAQNPDLKDTLVWAMNNTVKTFFNQEETEDIMSKLKEAMEVE